MIRDGKIDRVELVACIATLLASWIFLPLISFFVRESYSAAWMAVLAGSLVVWPVTTLFMNLIRRFPGKGLVEVTLELAGPFFGRLVVLGYALLFLEQTATSGRVFTEGIASVIMPRTPLSVHLAVFAAAGGLAAHAGIEPIGRLSWLLFPFSLVSLFILLVFNLNHLVSGSLFPVFGYGLKGVATSSLEMAGRFSVILALPILYPFLRKQSTAQRDGLTGLLLSVIVGVLVTIEFIMVFPDGEGQRRLFPLFELALLVQLGTFFTHIEVVFVFFWFFTSAIQLSWGLYVTNYCFCRVFDLPGLRPVVPIMIILFYALAFVPANVIEAVTVRTKTLLPLSFGFMVFSLLLLWVLYPFRRPRAAAAQSVIKE